MVAWDKSSLQQMAQGVAGYLDTARLAGDVEEVVRELRSLTEGRQSRYVALPIIIISIRF